MQAKIEESKASLVLAQAAVPEAMAASFRSGNLHILDYYKLQNVSADTEMRKSLAAAGQPRDTGNQNDLDPKEW